MKSKIISLFVLSFLMFFLAQLIRVYNGDLNIVGYPTYGLARVSQIFMSGSNYDPLAYQGHYVVYFPLYFYVLGALSVITSFDTYLASALMGPFMGAISALIFYIIIRQMGIKKRFAPFAAFIFTPISVYMFSHAGSRNPAFMISLLALYFFLKRRKDYIYLLAISALMHPIVAGFFFSFIFIRSYTDRRLREDLKPLAFTAILSILPYIAQLAVIGAPTPNVLHYEYSTDDRSTLNFSSIEDIVSFLPIDPFSAISLPIVLFAAFSVYKTRDRYLLALLVITLIPAFIMERFRIYLLFSFSLACARGFDKIKDDWAAIVLLSMVPFAISTSLWMSTLGPSRCFISLMPDSGDSSETIISNWQIGHWVESLANKKVFMDGTAEYVPDVDRRYSDFVIIFTSENRTLVEQKLISNNIDYILLLDSDYNYFQSRDMQVNIDKQGFEVLKQGWCGSLIKT